jgi:hypothetical protein
LLFTIGFFYFAMSEHAVYSDEEAVAQAAILANAKRDGPAGTGTTNVPLDSPAHNSI